MKRMYPAGCCAPTFNGMTLNLRAPEHERSEYPQVVYQTAAMPNMTLRSREDGRGADPAAKLPGRRVVHAIAAIARLDPGSAAVPRAILNTRHRWSAA